MIEIKRHIHLFFLEDSFGAQIDANLSLDLLNILKPISARARVLISVDPSSPSCRSCTKKPWVVENAYKNISNEITLFLLKLKGEKMIDGWIDLVKKQPLGIAHLRQYLVPAQASEMG